MALNDARDQAKCNALFLIDRANEKTDRIQFAGKLLGPIGHGLCISPGLETNENESANHMGHNAIIR